MGTGGLYDPCRGSLLRVHAIQTPSTLDLRVHILRDHRRDRRSDKQGNNNRATPLRPCDRVLPGRNPSRLNPLGFHTSVIRYWEILFLGLIIAITAIHTERFEEPRPVGPLFHFLWAMAYFIPVGLIAWANGSYWLGVAGVLLRFVAYNPILNAMRHKSWLYLNSGKNGSWWDEIELFWGKAYPVLWWMGAAGFIIIQFFIK